MTYSDNTNTERTIECEFCGHCYPQSYMTTEAFRYEVFDVCKGDCARYQRREYSRLLDAAECFVEQINAFGRIVTDERIATMPHVVAAIEARTARWNCPVLTNALISALRSVPLHMSQACGVEGENVALRITSETKCRVMQFHSLTGAQWYCYLQFKQSPERIFDAAVVQPVNVDSDIYLTIADGFTVTLAELIPTLQPFDAVAYCGTANPDQIAHERDSFVGYLETLADPRKRAQLMRDRAVAALKAKAAKGHDEVPF